MKRILINATQNEEIRVALCKGNHLYDFDLENRTREQKKSNIYKGHVTRVEPSLEAVFVEYGSQRQGFLPIREISAEYLSGNPRDENIKKLIKEGDELIVQVEKEERGNKGAALSTYVSLAGRYLVLMPNNPRGGGISRQISGKLREDMKRMLSNLDLPKGMSVIIRTAGIGKTQEDLQHDLNHLLNIWQAIQEQNQKYPSPRLVHQEAGVVTRAVRDYLRDDIAEIWIDNENAYIEAAGFIDAVMPKQAEKLRKYTDYEPMFSRFNIEKQIETAYQREVRLPSGGSIVIDQTEALVSIDINSAKSTKGSDVAETAYHTNLEAADEIARQLRLRDMGGLIVIDFIDMNDNKHQKEVEKRLIDATKYDRARVQFGDISKFGLMEMSRQRLRPSLEESTGYICPRCHGNGMIRDLRSLSLSIMRQIEQIALKERQGEVQAEVPTDIAAFLLNEKRDSLVYLEQDSGTRITILPHAHLESPNFKLHFNRDGFAPSSYERITDTAQEHSDLGYEVDWQTAEKERPEQQPTRQPRQAVDNKAANNKPSNTVEHSNDHRNNKSAANVSSARAPQASKSQSVAAPVAPVAAQAPAPAHVETAAQPQAVAWLSNLFAQAPQASTTPSVSSRDAAEAIEALVNTGAQSLGSFGQTDNSALTTAANPAQATQQHSNQKNEAQQSNNDTNRQQDRRASDSDTDDSNNEDRRRRKPRKSRSSKPRQRKDQTDETSNNVSSDADSNTSENAANNVANNADDKQSSNQDKRQHDNRRTNDRNRNNRQDSNNQNSNRNANARNTADDKESEASEEQVRTKRKSHTQRGSRGKLERGETLTAENVKQHNQQATASNNGGRNQANTRRNQNPNEVVLQVNEAPAALKPSEVVHLSLDDSKSTQAKPQPTEKQSSTNDVAKDEVAKAPNAQPQTNSRSADKKEADIKVTAEKTTDNNAVEVSEAKVDSTAKDNSYDVQNHVVKADANTDVKKPVVDEQAVSKSDTDSASDTVKPVVAEASSTTVVDKSQEANTPDKAATDEVAIDETTKRSNEGDNAEKAASTQATSPSVEVSNSSSNDSDSAKSSSALELTHEALFASRYVTAEKFGQASNDPRVVLSQQAQSQVTSEPQVNEQAVVSVPAIRGTVGEFIRATLPEAQTRLIADGVINCFIETVALHMAQAQSSDNSATVSAIDSNELANQSFNFSNYGYQPLAADYLARFETMTQAVSQFAATQGKTDVEPRAIGKRASNDPRGQHPDYQEPAVLSLPTEQAADTSTEQVVSEKAENEVDAHNVEANALASQAQTDDVSADSEQLLEADQALSEPTNQPAEENTAAENVDSEETSVTSDEATADTAIELAPEAKVEEPTKEEIQAAKSKTTIASYKNMIENVAEQLLPQTGMFNLTTPKVPKARTRKPKTDHKKPTQAEQLDSDNSDS
ncbi:Rne/Rng family ribonuclease [Psychrobacter sp. SCQQ22]|uniref:Rne/Rng family ribonuclease n=1 Tax=Psychrobacter sp. SCQQ22 TaxID=2792059 RepID=UPI0018CDD741|nr:Rne/Rng family ribonuclease [Psychrobacter sp. SCQQ22]MBH0084983.1 Rne/Rng family ribonuclease [Psychrobacter sp. SCQQ22]